MPKRGPNPIARGAALVALVLAFMLVIYTVSTSGDGDGNGNGDTAAEAQQKIHPRFQRAINKGFYIVRPGDTLTAIADGTGIDVDDIMDLNPQVDPQALISGQRIKLR